MNKYLVPNWLFKSVSYLRPEEKLSVSAWAEKYRVLNAKSAAMPGKWNNEVTPYLVGIMDAFSDAQTREITFVKPTQVGGTTAMENMIGWLIQSDPSPTMVVYPSDDLAKSTSENRLQQMIADCEALNSLFHANDSQVLELQFDNMYLSLTGANSPADLASKPIKYLFLDEVDKFPGASKKEADPVKLATERTKTFFNRKIVKMSTPTTRTGLIWKSKEQSECEKHFFVPCPHCGEMIELKFNQIKWGSKEDYPDISERVATAKYVCQICGCFIDDRQKVDILKHGEWRSVSEKTKRATSVCFWLNTLYSPFVKFRDIAREFLSSKDDSDLLHNFTNSWLAEVWEDTKIKTSADTVLERQTDIEEFVVPDWAKMLTGGVDVQENCLYWSVRAWGDMLTSQNIAHGQVLGFGEITNIMNLAYKKQNGEELIVSLALIDSGDQTDEVYEYCAMNSEWALPCKGTGTMLSHYKLSTVNKTTSRAYGMNLVLVDGGKYKDMIASRMQKENGTGSWMVHKNCDAEYCEQVTAEQKITEKKGGRETYRWVPKSSHAANHYLDTEVYAAAAADICGVRSLFLQNKDVQKSEVQEENFVQENYENSWIKEGGFY